MIPLCSAEVAITLSDQGWTVSAIARHLGHDRKTIRIYLNGRREPGQPRRQADSFTRFAGYAARRLREDPHLRAAGLHRELAVLGYPGSYSALTRELRNSGVPTTCPTCRDQPSGEYRPAPTRNAGQHLPITVPPLSGETIASYLTRLARANHLSGSLLLAHLPPWFTARRLTHDDLTGAASVTGADVDHLAALTGLGPATLVHALPALRPSPDGRRPAVRATHACRRCAARQAPAGPVPVHLPVHRRVCVKHRLWLGDSIQIDLSAAPDIIHAAHRAERLARRHTGPRLVLAELAERQQITPGRQGGAHLESVHKRISALSPTGQGVSADHPDLIEAATYPETISGAARSLRCPAPTTGPD